MHSHTRIPANSPSVTIGVAMRIARTIALSLTLALLAVNCKSTPGSVTQEQPSRSPSPSLSPSPSPSPRPSPSPKKTKTPTPPPVVDPPSLGYSKSDAEYKLASIDAGFPLGTNDPSIDAYASVLDQLERACHEDRTTLGDMAVVARDLLKKKGKTLTLLKILQSVKKSIPGAAPRMPCSDVFASLVILIGRN